MNKKKSFGESLEAFFAGKGFYIVLFLCVAVIGVSAWSMLAGNGTDVEDNGDRDMSLSDTPDEEAEMTGLTDYPYVNELPEETENVFIPEPPEVVEEEPVVQEVPEEPQSVVSNGYYIWPVSGQIENAYSVDALIYNKTMADWRTHDGLDISAQLGDVVLSVSAGTVSAVFDDDMFGTTVIIDHGNGVCSIYSNLAETPTVSVGQTVGIGEIIGSVGDTALCEAGETAHLHFAMTKDGESADPENYLP